MSTYGYHGSETLKRDHRGLVVKTSKTCDSTVLQTHRRKVSSGEMIFSGGPACREYKFDTISDKDRRRLEKELGAKFKERDNA